MSTDDVLPESDQIDIISGLGGWYLSGPYAAVKASERETGGQTSLVYTAATGELSVVAPAGRQLTSINVESAAGILTGQPAQNLGGNFDNDDDTNIFKATFRGSFSSLSFGYVAPSGISEDFIRGDLTVVGSLLGGEDLGDVDLIYVPEPGSIVLLVVGLLAVVARRPWP